MMPPLVAAVLTAEVEGEADMAERVARRVYAMTSVDEVGQERESLEQVRDRVPGAMRRYAEI